MWMVTGEQQEIVFRLLAALLAGVIIGYERSFHGRPAGLRTHMLVCVASAMLMLVTVYQTHWMSAPDGVIRLDPTRMAQGIMTGIGFLGAGVIVKEGMSVRGLTTSASIWVTAAIGILAGIGFYFPLVLSVVLVFLVLSVFRWVEKRVPSQVFYHFDVQFVPATDMSEAVLRDFISSHGFSVADFSYRLYAEKRVRRHKMVLWSLHRTSAARLAETLEKNGSVIEFRIAPISS